MSINRTDLGADTSSNHLRSSAGRRRSAYSSINPRLTPPDSSDEVRIRAPPSPTGAVYHGWSGQPEILNYMVPATARAGSPVSETTTAVEHFEEPTDTNALRRRAAAIVPRRRERFDPVALAELVSDPSQGDSSEDENSEDEHAADIPLPPLPQSENLAAPTEWQMNCDTVDWEAPFDVAEEYDSEDERILWGNIPESTRFESHYEAYLRNLEPAPHLLKPFFHPTGKWSFSEGQDLTNVRVIKTLGEGGFAKAYIKEAELYGEKITFVSKEWNLHANDMGFFAELALYLSPRYLRKLQGDCIPEIIGLFRKGRTITIAFALPHADSWMEAHPDMPIEIKDKILEAYRKIHARGVLHGDVGLRHWLVGDDHKVTIIDFNYSAALESQPNINLSECNEAQIEREFREVKVKLRYDGAMENELKLIDRYKELKVLDDIAYEERRQAARAARAAKRGKKRKSPDDVKDECEVQIPEAEYGLTDDECPRDWRKVYGVDERLLQTEEGLYKWIKRRQVSRRMIVPGRTANLESLPPFNPDRQEDEVTREFIRKMNGEVPTSLPVTLELAPPVTDASADAELTLSPVETDTTSTHETVAVRSIWTLPQRVLRTVNQCLSAILPFAFPSPPDSSSVVSGDELLERPRKRARIRNGIL